MPVNIVEHYQIVEVLGEGGMGIVYKALDLKLERYIALKILSSHALSNPQFVERFKREARNQAKLNHPNIVPVYGFTEEGRTLGIVMEYVDGETLEHLIERRGRLPLAEAAAILKQILHGIGYAHSKGFVHRDIKPSNIIISSEGTAKIMDFGISKSINEGRGITKTGVKIGTLLYMSPEQIKAYEPTPQSDIYSIGLTFYEMLNGQNPFDKGTDYEIMEAHLKKNPPKLSSVYGDIPAVVDKVISKALQKSVEKRYKDSFEFLADLEEMEKKSSAGKIMTSDRKKWNIGLLILAFTVLFVFSSIFMLVYNNVSEMWNKDAPKTEDSLSVKDSYISNPNYILRSGWTAAETGIKSNLNGIHFISEQKGFACGSEGTILMTEDGGVKWKSISDSAAGSNYYDISFIDDTTGFIAGENGVLLYTTDGGAGWNERRLGDKTLFSINYNQSSGTIFITSGDGAIYRSEDRGENWSVISAGAKAVLYDMDFAGSSSYVCGWAGLMLKSNDGGRNWFNLGSIADTYLRTAAFIDKDKGFAGGGGGGLFFTNDGGKTWEKRDIGITSGIYKIKFLNGKEGILVGNRGEIFTTNDAGSKWSKIESGTFASLTDIYVFSDKKTIIAGSNGTILYSRIKLN